MRDSIGQERWSLPNPFLGTASSSVLTCSNNTRKQPAGDYFGERRNLSGVSLSRLRVRKTCRHVLVCTPPSRVPMSVAAAFQQRPDPVPDFKIPMLQPFWAASHLFLLPPMTFFPTLYVYWDVGPPSQCVCVCVWYKVLEGILRNDRVSLSSFDKHSYILRNSLTCCRGRRPSCLFPVKLLIWKQTQCLR